MSALSICTRGLSGTTLAAVLAHASWAAAAHSAELWAALPALAALCLAAAGTAWLAGSREAAHTARISLTFVLAALLTLPAPGPLLVALAAVGAGRGGGVAGLFRRGMAPAAATGVAVVAAQSLLAVYSAIPPPPAPEALLRALLAFLAIQGLATALGLALAPLHQDIPDRPTTRALRLLLIETANVPLAWLLAALLHDGSWLEVAVLGALILFALASLIGLDRTTVALRESHLALSSRLAELATIHDIGREILSSIQPERVFVVLERECRKIFPVDACFVALVDRDIKQLRLSYRQRRRSRVECGGPAIRGGIARWVLEEKRPRRVDDLRQTPLDSPVRGDLVEPDTRSLMAVPLIVEDRVIGVLTLQSRMPHAYDDHGLSVLTTIAQQAAVAIENARHYQMATVDSLTGFFLRDHFFQRLAEEDRRVRRYGGRFALLMVDLDGFKEINDTHGHLAGDGYLRQVSATIHEQLRAADLACRYGGDEFCLLLPETDMRGAAVIAERVRQAVAHRIVPTGDRGVRTTVSIGIAAFPDNDSGDLQGLMRNADEALYRAKRGGRDRVVPYAA